ncbi:MAG: phytoene/squalene synthase family protein [Wenzhouxiangellaceae bacterium]|nr:phytoene/squalene synthase family protein [Wenzhouxiangellaceae bacterium]
MNRMDQVDEPALAPALEFQAAILGGVSRTFALTIPSLPEPLRIPVTNAYLLCRIADTIEDDAALDLSQKRDFAARFVAVLDGDVRPEAFSASLADRLGPTTLDAERELVARTGEVVRITQSFSPAQRTALIRCVRLMSAGMHRFQQGAGRQGLATMREMDEYCYYVAGVVGEMLTELFCDHSPAIERNRDELMRLAPSFGQGLQMTNILKDIWDDRERGICWLPRHEFGQRDGGADDLVASLDREAFGAGLERLVVIAHGHLRNALEYTLLIPGEFRGIRRFCLWALGMAVPTLRNIYRNSEFRSGDEVKITRRDVRRIVRRYGLFAGNDAIVCWLFARASRGLPESDPRVGDRLDEISRRAGMNLAEVPGESKQRSVTVT